jgi:uncharacterized protein
MMRAFSWTWLGAAGAVAMLTAAMSSGSAAPSGPSFDCAKASLPDEKAICADPQLSAIDRLIARAYKGFEPAYGGDKKAIAQALNADRRQCGTETACLAAVMSNALQTFDLVPAWVDQYTQGLIGKKALDVAADAPQGANQPMPTKIGDCAVTHIAELTTRFGDPLATADANAGSRVSFSNGGGLVSYGREEGLANSEIGDPAVVCLMSIPRDCPAGDDRGKVYYGVDLTRHGTWMLPDSQHGCGGA